MQGNGYRQPPEYSSGGARRTAWDSPAPAKPHSDNRRAPSGARVRTVVLIVVLVLCVLTNTVYSGARAVFGHMDLVKDKPTEPEQQSVVVLSDSDLEELNAMGEDELDTSNLVISDKDVEIILLVGSDARMGESAARSDTLMLIAIDRIHKKLKVISIMRDLYANISGVKGSNKINFAYYYDSAKLNYDLKVTRATIKDCFGLEVDHFAVVDLEAFVDFIEAIGEVEVELTKAEAIDMDTNARWYQPRYMGCREAGVYSLNGREALAYVRMRHTGEGDFDRTRRQRDFLKLLMDKAMNMSYAQMVKALTVVLPHITTDMDENQIFGYCFDAPNLLKYEMVQLRFPIEGSYYMSWATIGSTNVSILLTNYTFCAQAIQAFIYDDDMTYVGGAKASGVALPTVTTISFTTTTTGPSEEATEPPAPVEDTTAAPPPTTTAETTAAPPPPPPADNPEPEAPVA